MAKEIKFTEKPPGGDRVYHISPDDVRVVLGRLPDAVYSRLKRVHFNDRSRGGRVFGYTNGRRREIALCSLPPRMSLRTALVKGQRPEQFGALNGSQWPTLAIRRFLLYDVLLHEIGHLQVIDETVKDEYRKFAREAKAQEFGMYWCERLWARPFEHPDPVHNPPTKEELKSLYAPLVKV